ncbi:DUF2339 domain-containing protein [Phyllobacterium sp. YR531]|uniref:DUF2339 domain-containing protein n=1 Tax=Phyllobacterium sp. YR531 TaxID=1144343 RepID=UPI00026F6C6E|nr:DUF2339 domain-containing protein [Phyllobacterium sp. YR531]EJN05158.1 putative membrane protein [Phyllobacterium sp. YR531]
MSIVIAIIALILAGLSRQQSNMLQRRIEQLEKLLATRLAATGEPSKASPQTASLPSATLQPTAINTPKSVPPAEPVPAVQPLRAAPQSPRKIDPAIAAVKVAAPKKSYGDYERSIGRNWPVWIGGIALFLGGIFVVQYSIENALLGPGIRLCIGAIFGLALLAAGEYLRRKDAPFALSPNATNYIPGVLTAVGSSALFAVVYAAHGIYGFIGAPVAFTLLGAVGIATLLIAVKHGPWIAGLGLVGAFLTPAIVSSEAPAPYSFVLYLIIVATVATALSRLKNWQWIGGAAILLASLWGAAYGGYTLVPSGGALTLLVICLLGLALFGHLKPKLYQLFDGSEKLYFDPITIAGAIGVLAIGLACVSHGLFSLALSRFLIIAALIIAASAIVPLFVKRTLPFIVTAAFLAILPLFQEDLIFLWRDGFYFAPYSFYDEHAYRLFAILGAIALFIIGAASAGLLARLPDGIRAPAYGALGSAVPLAMITIMLVTLAYEPQWTEKLLTVGFAIVTLGAATWLAGLWNGKKALVDPSWLFDAASLAFAFLALVVWFEPWGVVLGASALAVAYTLITRTRLAPVLRFAPAFFAVIIIGEIIYDPTIVGADALSPRPVFNQLLLYYGAFALAMVASQIILARRIKDTAYRLAQALGVLVSFVLVNVLAHHWLNGGTWYGGDTNTLSQQSLYSIISLGASLCLMMLSRGGQDWLYRIASIVIGYLGIAYIAVQHFVLLNPLLTGHVGNGLILNSLFLGYLLPGLLTTLLALNAFGGPQIRLFGLPIVMTQTSRPKHYAIILAIAAGLMLFTWITLTIRVFYWGSSIVLDWGIDSMEMFTYSAVWLLFGFGLFGLGVWQQNRLLRLISAPVVFLVIAKVFLLDMSNLEGILRALSFIGLGLSLVGVGLFYQRILNADAARATATPPTSDRNDEPDPALDRL